MKGNPNCPVCEGDGVFDAGDDESGRSMYVKCPCIEVETLRAEAARLNQTSQIQQAFYNAAMDRAEAAEKEAASLREQVAALQPYADGYAGLLAEKGEAWQQGYEAAKAQAYHHLVYVVGDNYTAKSIRDMQPEAPRPDAQEATNG